MGALIYSETRTPSQQGALVYFYCKNSTQALQRVEELGGKIMLPTTPIGDGGYYAHFCDTEGNLVGLYSME